MMAQCPRHGLRHVALISPDLEPEAEVDRSQIVLVDLFWEDRVEYNLTLSRDFARRHGIVEATLDYRETFVGSQWFPQLKGICGECYGERWPELLEEMRGRNR
jgi:hypothetical protein